MVARGGPGVSWAIVRYVGWTRLESATSLGGLQRACLLSYLARAALSLHVFDNADVRNFLVQNIEYLVQETKAKP